MTTPQDPARRLKQKRRRETRLEKWRAKQSVTAKDTKPATPKAVAAKA